MTTHAGSIAISRSTIQNIRSSIDAIVNSPSKAAISNVYEQLKKLGLPYASLAEGVVLGNTPEGREAISFLRLTSSRSISDGDLLKVNSLLLRGYAIAAGQFMAPREALVVRAQRFGLGGWN